MARAGPAWTEAEARRRSSSVRGRPAEAAAGGLVLRGLNHRNVVGDEDPWGASSSLVPGGLGHRGGPIWGSHTRRPPECGFGWELGRAMREPAAGGDKNGAGEKKAGRRRRKSAAQTSARARLTQGKSRGRGRSVSQAKPPTARRPSHPVAAWSYRILQNTDKNLPFLRVGWNG